jgi:hypothetical protein
MDQIEAMRQRIARAKAEAESLKELWLTLLPAEWLPSERQFITWLNIYDFHTAAYGLETASNRLNRKEFEAEEKSAEVTWDKSACIRFASGVMKQQQYRDNPGGDKVAEKNANPGTGKGFEVEAPE